VKKTEELTKLTGMSDDELIKHYGGLKRELFDARVSTVTRVGLPTSEMRRLRRSIARTITVVRGRKIKIS